MSEAAPDARLGGPGVTAQPGAARAVLGPTVRDGDAEARRIAAERARAARTVAGHALDGPDCQMLLLVLGLSAVEGKPGGWAVLTVTTTTRKRVRPLRP